MSAGVSIRRIRPEEYAEVGALVRAAYEGDYALRPSYVAEIEDVAGRDAVAEVVVAVDDETQQILGTITLPRPGARLQDDTEPGEMDIRLLGVSHLARGRGIGECIMRYCEAVARERGATRLVLHTASFMTGPRRLYERLGYERIPEREFDFEEMGETRRLLAYGLALESVTTAA